MLRLITEQWKQNYRPQLVEIFKAHGVQYPSVVIDQGIIKDYENTPWDLSVEELECLISESETVIASPELAETAWKRNGDEPIAWALHVLGIGQETQTATSEITSDEESEPSKPNPILGISIYYGEENPKTGLSDVIDFGKSDHEEPIDGIPDDILERLWTICEEITSAD